MSPRTVDKYLNQIGYTEGVNGYDRSVVRDLKKVVNTKDDIASFISRMWSDRAV